MTVAIVVPRWPPAYGGGEQYMDRMVGALLERTDWDIRILTTTLSDDDQYVGVSGLPDSCITRVPNDSELQRYYALGWVPHYASWIDSLPDVDLVIFASPATLYLRNFQSGILESAYVDTRIRGIPFGFIHYDLDPTSNEFLGQRVIEGMSWQQASDEFISLAKDLHSQDRWHDFCADYELPSVHRPDFIISCSEWSLKHIDPLDQIPSRMVLHPLMDFDYYSESVPSFDGTDHHVGFVNPIGHKGCVVAYDVANSMRDLRHVWLKGGHGNASKQHFLEIVRTTQAQGLCDIEIVDFVQDIRSFFGSLANGGMFLFPSRFEGYGMAPVEAMACGIPVVSTDHPATVEGVGDAAVLVNPFAPSDHWEFAIEDILDDRQRWISAGFARVQQLRDRQETEIKHLIGLIREFI